jgi:hypothetical protein
MFRTDPYLTLDLNRQRQQRLRDEMAADTLAHRVRRIKRRPQEPRPETATP